MNTYVAFLRAINVGGRRIASDDLAAVFAALGYDDVATYLASGNVVFRADEQPKAIESAVEEAFAADYDWDVPTFVRTLDRVADLAASDVFDEPGADQKAYVIFGKSDLEAHQPTLDTLSNEIDQLEARGREIYWLRDMEAGESQTTGEIESVLGVELTRRTVRTLERLVTKFQ